MTSTTLFPRNSGLPLLSVIAVLIVAAPMEISCACDVCLRPPRVPFTSEYPAAMEIAMATREALESGLIDPAAPLTITQNPQRLDNVSSQQLIKMWAQSQPLRHRPQLRLTIDVVLIDEDRIYHLDIRMGHVLFDASQSGPCDVQLLTTKAGFSQLLAQGLDVSLRQRLVVLETDSDETREAVEQTFPARRPANRHPESGNLAVNE